MKKIRILPGLVFGAIAAVSVAFLGVAGAPSGPPSPLRLSGGPSGPLSPQAGDQHPSALFLEYCAKCHGQDGTANTPKGKQLMARDFTDAEWQSSKTDAQLIKTVTEGGEDMPAFGKKLTREQVESLVKDDVRGFSKKK
jgi:mono/diheme cytochrome c family protein